MRDRIVSQSIAAEVRLRLIVYFYCKKSRNSQSMNENRFANKKAFIFVFGIIGLLFASSHAYYNGTITTVEKRFKISSKNMGFIATGNDISSFIVTIFIAYYGGKGERDFSNYDL